MSLKSILTRKLGRNRNATANLLLMLASVALFAWIIILWASPMPGTPAETGEAAAPPEKETAPARAERASFEAITEKDLFRPDRRKYTAPVIAKPKVKETKVVVVVAPPPPKTPPPKLVLVGTALVDNGNAAILDYNGPVKKGFYKVGDRIEDFTISDIKKDSIVLERDGEYVKYMMNQATPVFIGGSQVYNPSMPQPAITLR